MFAFCILFIIPSIYSVNDDDDAPVDGDDIHMDVEEDGAFIVMNEDEMEWERTE